LAGGPGAAEQEVLTARVKQKSDGANTVPRQLFSTKPVV